MKTNLPSKAQTISLIVCMGLVIASISVPLSVYESLERQVDKWLQETRADDLMVSLFSPAQIEQLSKHQAYEMRIFAPLEVPDIDTIASNVPDTVYYFTPARMAALQSLPHVEAISWSRPYYSCDFFVRGYEKAFILNLISPGFLEIQGMRIIQGRAPTSSDLSHVAVIGSDVARILFGASESAIGQEILADATSGKDCKNTLTVIGVLAPMEDSNNPVEQGMDRGIYIPDREPLEIAYLNKIPLVLPVSALWVSPRRGYRQEAIGEILNYFQGESGANVYVQIMPRREYYQSFGGIQARLAYLPFIGNIVGLVAFAASLNIGLIIFSRLDKKRYEIGVRRSLGSSRFKILGEQTIRMFPSWIIAIGTGLTLSLALTPVAGDMFQARHVGEPFPVSLGPLTAIFATVTGFLLGSAVTIVTVRFFLQKSPAALLRERDRSLAGGLKGKLTGGAGLAAGTLALIILFGLRDGAVIQFDRILGWAGGDRAGAIVDWRVTTNFDKRNADLSYHDYLFLNEHFPEAQFGWLGRKGSLSNVQSIEASASINVIRPPMMLAGRWITPDEEQHQTHVAVLGYDLGHQLAKQRGISLDALVGQNWRSYTIIGVMDEWPLRHGLGYYTDVAYVPIGTRGEETYYPGGQIPFIAPQGVNIQEFIHQIRQALETRHPEGTPQFILAADKVGELLEWRLRLYFLLNAFAVVSLLIGSFGVMNLIFMWVVSRWREIGIRRAVGATRGEIARMVLAQALQITLLATLVGGAIGTAIALVVQQRSGWPMTIYPYWLAVVAGIAVFSALIFGGLPALWAASRTPTEMLRME